MLRLTACIEMMFQEHEFIDRIAAAAAAGVQGVEFWDWTNKDLPAVSDAAKAAGMPITSCTFSTKDPALRATWNQYGMLDRSNRQALADMVGETASAVLPHGISTMILTTGNTLPDRTHEQQHEAIIECLQYAAPVAEKAGVRLILEPLNPVVDHIGYYLNKSAQAFEIVRTVNHPSLRLLFDIYHQQVAEGNVTLNIVNNIDLIGHFHVADSPGRHEPGTGEMNYENIFTAIAKAGYTGWIGLEYRPTVQTEGSLSEVLRCASKA